MQWIELTTEEQLQNILEKSFHTPQLIYKHSKLCSISAVIRNRLEKNAPPQGLDFYFLDIWAYRVLSNKISVLFAAHHESPQVLLIKNGRCIYVESHWDIRMDEIGARCAAA